MDEELDFRNQQTIGNGCNAAPALSLSNSLNYSYLPSNKKKYTFFTSTSSVAATHIRITSRCEGEVRAHRGIKTEVSKQGINFPTRKWSCSFILISHCVFLALFLKATQQTDINIWQQKRKKCNNLHLFMHFQTFCGEKILVQLVLLGVSNTLVDFNSSCFFAYNEIHS